MIGKGERKRALERAELHSPFLRETARALPEVASVFVANGAEAAIRSALALSGDEVGVELRRRRTAL
ncbi:MAG TPA: hypothetical protein VM326_03720, partial [Sphingomicrobium sp.]|nr:hypothetical protein [Sphingomicrobium sp.]